MYIFQLRVLTMECKDKHYLQKDLELDRVAFYGRTLSEL